MARVSGTDHSEADDATRGSAVKLVAEIVSRLLLAAVSFVLLRGLGAADFGRYTKLVVFALLVAELGELGLQNLASRALVAGTHSLRALVRARVVLAGVVATAAALAVPLAPALGGLASAALARLSRAEGASLAAEPPLDGVALAGLVAWLALSGWGEFIGVALRCRRARRHEALLLLVLRGGGLAFVAAALAAGAGLRGVALALAFSPLPSLALGATLLRRRPEPHPSAESPPLAVLRESAPLGVHGALLLLSPRVEFLVLSGFAPASEYGLFAAATLVIWPLSMVPSAVVAGAMPALTREALSGGEAVRRRTAGTLAVLSAPVAVGLALVAVPLVRLLLGGGYDEDTYAAAAGLLRALSACVPATFLNALVAGALIASGHPRWLPRLTAGRVAFALVLALALVPRFGAWGAAGGLVIAEWTLLAAGVAVCRRSGFAVHAVAPLVGGLAACVPMALAVSGVRSSLVLAVPLGALTWAATLAAAWRLVPGLARRNPGHVRYP
jgi:O-antigen/teichoic acid export membrane protein